MSSWLGARRGSCEAGVRTRKPQMESIGMPPGIVCFGGSHLPAVGR
jgi:hypothetical protein